MKKIFRLGGCLLLLLALAACGGAPAEPPAAPTEESLTGELPDILASVIEGANATLPEPLPQSFEDPVTAEDCQGMLGLTPEQFAQYVEGAYVSNAALTTSAHEIALVKCKDAAAAAEVKQLIAAGFDSAKWVCVLPDESSVIDSGSYVLLCVTLSQYSDALTASFKALAADNTGEKVVFYTGAE
ncbi:MAG: DUF4358 domain-containing protein [Gracilibacteraceae bacterium]|nr:DUF4358 domain-containing protein [Gracilibacteraceae bacterium]